MQALAIKTEKNEINIRVTADKKETYVKDMSSEFNSELSLVEKEELEVTSISLLEIEKKLTLTTENLETVTSEMNSLNAELNSKLFPQKQDILSQMSQEGLSYLSS